MCSGSLHASANERARHARSLERARSLAICVATAFFMLAAMAGQAHAAPPSNDNFADAVNITLDGTGHALVNGTNVEATGEVDEPSGSGTLETVWYTWTATNSETVTVDTSGCDYDAYLHVYTGAALNALTFVTSDDDSGSGACSLASFTPTPGTTYRIRIDGWSSSVGTFPLSLQQAIPLPAPPNDDFADAEELVLVAGSAYGDSTLVGATSEAGEQPGSGTLNSIWYRWTAPDSAVVRIHTDGCVTDTWLDVFTGATLPSLQLIASADTGGTPSPCAGISFSPTVGETYYLRVDGTGSAIGLVTIQLDTLPGPFPPNDQFVNAENLGLTGAGSVSVSGTTVGATLDAGEPAASGVSNSVWYRWTSPASPVSTARLDTNGCANDVVAYLFTGSSLATLTQLASDDSSGTPSLCASISFPVAASTTYWFRIDGKNDTTGSFPLNLTHFATVANDHFANAETMVLNGSGFASASGDTSNATGEPGEPSNAKRTVWYRWDAPVVLPGDGPLVLDTNGCSYDSYLYVYAGASLSTLTTVASDDDSGTSNCSKLSFVPVAGTTYYFRVSAPFSSSGSHTLNAVLKVRPPHDDFADAAVLVLDGSGIADVSTTDDGATDEPGEPSADGTITSVWFSWTPPVHETVRASIVNCDRSMRLDAFKGSAVNALSRIAAASSSCPSFRISVDAGRTVLFRADGHGSETGTVRVQLERISAAANDDFSNAAVLVLDGSGIASATGDSEAASVEVDEPTSSGQLNSLWYGWTAASTAPVTVDTNGCSPAAYSEVELYVGSTLATLGSSPGVTSLNDLPSGCERQRLIPTPGTTYWIRISSSTDDPLPVRIQQHQPPPNDAFVNAEILTLSGGGVMTTGSTVLATGEAGEPAAAGSTDSIWYSWTAPSTQTVQVDTNDCLHDTVLYVYTGSSVSSLTQIATDDDSGSPTSCSSLTFTPTAGTTYHIRVDAKTATQDETDVRLNVVAVPANDMFANAENIVLNAGGFATSNGSTTAATGEAGEPSASGAVTSVWYRWVPTANNPIDISTIGCTFDTVLYVYEGSSLGSLSDPNWSGSDYNDDGPAGHGRCSRFTIHAPQVGQPYYIRVDGKNGSTGMFPITLQQRTGPANDDFANAELLSGWIASTTGDLQNASKESGESTTAGYFATVWYRWVAPASGATTIAVSSCGQQSGLGVTDSSGYPVSWKASASHYNSPKCKNVTFMAVAGTTYRISVGGSYYFDANSNASFTLSINSPPNDDFANATVLTASPSAPAVQDSYDDQYNVGADHEPGEPSHAGNAGAASVWYSFTPTTTQTWAVDVFGPRTGAAFDTLVGVYTGASVGALTSIAANDDAANAPVAGLSRAVFVGIAGTTYHIAVDGKGGASGRFGIRIGNAAPTNDDLANAEVVAGTDFATSGTLNLATMETAESSAPYSEATATVWYRYVAPTSGWLMLDTIGTATSVAVDTFSGSTYPLASAGDSAYALQAHYYYVSGCTPSFPTPRPRLQVVAGQTYSIRVSNDSANPSGFGNFTLRGTLNGGAASNDAFAAAIPIGDSDYRCFDTIHAGLQAGEPVHAGVSGGASLWYTYTPSVSGIAQIAVSNYRDHYYRYLVSGQSFDPVLAVYTGNSLGTLVEVASNDDAPYSSSASDVRFFATAGVTYRIAVDTVGGEQRLGAIHVNPAMQSSYTVSDGPAADIDFTTVNTSLAANVSSVSSWFHYESIDWAAYRTGHGGSCDAPELTANTPTSSVTIGGPVADGDWVMCMRTRSAFVLSPWSTSDSVIIDTGATSPTPLVDGTDTASDIDYQSNTGTLRATWDASLDPSGVTRYETCYSSAVDASGCTGTILAGWTNIGLATSHALTGQTLAEASVWYVCVRTTDTLAQVAVACTDGSMIDTFAPTNPVSIYDLSTSFSSDGDLHGVDVHVTASWSPGADAASGVRDYDACISTSSVTCSAAPGTSMQSGITSRTLDISVASTTLGNGAMLYTCVRTHDVAGNVAASWACSDGFVVDASAPDVPTLVSPADGSLDLDTTPTLTATYTDPVPATAGMVEFRVGSSMTCGVGLVASGTNAGPVASGSSPTYTVASPLSPGRYYWCARAVDNAGNTSAWSPTRAVIVEGSSSIGVGGCAGSSIDLGVIAPGAGTTTSTPCTVAFGSSDGTSMLRVAQTDGVGSAMTDGVHSIDDFAGTFGPAGAFGICTEDVAAGAVPVSPVAGAGNCLIASSAVWASVPTTPRKLASTSVVGTENAQVDVRFGIRTATTQLSGAYAADITFSVIAPNF